MIFEVASTIQTIILQEFKDVHGSYKIRTLQNLRDYFAASKFLTVHYSPNLEVGGFKKGYNSTDCDCDTFELNTMNKITLIMYMARNVKLW